MVANAYKTLLWCSLNLSVSGKLSPVVETFRSIIIHSSKDFIHYRVQLPKKNISWTLNAIHQLLLQPCIKKRIFDIYTIVNLGQGRICYRRQHVHAVDINSGCRILRGRRRGEWVACREPRLLLVRDEHLWGIHGSFVKWHVILWVK